MLHSLAVVGKRTIDQHVQVHRFHDVASVHKCQMFVKCSNRENPILGFYRAAGGTKEYQVDGRLIDVRLTLRYWLYASFAFNRSKCSAYSSY
jgi:hypothetical protein